MSRFESGHPLQFCSNLAQQVVFSPIYGSSRRIYCLYCYKNHSNIKLKYQTLACKRGDFGQSKWKNSPRGLSVRS
jgi:hypothetical protein